MSLLQSGTEARLEVIREAEFGYFLSNGVDELLLHRRDMQVDSLAIGEEVDVFLYTDGQGRLSATMFTPALMYGEAGWLRVIDQEPGLGLFLDIELQRDLLLTQQ